MIRLQGVSQIITHDETLEVSRQVKSSYVDGKIVPRAADTFKITTNVQPVNGRDLLLVPEGDRFKEQLWLFMNQSERPIEVNDIVLRLGIRYQTQSVENWGSYSRARIMRLDVGPHANP